MKKILSGMVCVSLLSLPVGLMAATSLEKQAAIDAGLAYLASQQNADGSWTDVNGSGYNDADTAAALLSFVDQSYKPIGWNGVNYSSVVTNATNYLLSHATSYNFGTGNWWGYGNGSSGLYWVGAGESTYVTGLAIPALARLVTNPYGGSPLLAPTTVINSSNNAVNGLTYAQVIQKSVDTFTFGQSNPGAGNQFGGWRYFPSQNQSDMSTTQWPVIDYLFAKQVPGVSIPGPGSQTMLALQAWLTAVQNPVTGGVDYAPNNGIINATHAGGLILSNYLAGGGGNPALALQWLNGDWKTGPNGVWYGNEGNPYAMWAVYKALETVYGTNGAGPITNLNPQGAADIDSGATWNWWEDYCQYLVDTQNGNGSWNGYEYWQGALADAWYINILNATQTGPNNTPEPSAVLLFGSGLIGLAAYARKKNKK